MHPIIVLLLIAVWLGAMWLGFMYVFPVLFAATLVVAGAAALGVYCLHACRTLAPSSLEGPSPVAAPDVAYRHYLLGQVWRDKAFGIDAWPTVIGDSVTLRIEAEAQRVRGGDARDGARDDMRDDNDGQAPSEDTSPAEPTTPPDPTP